jgi:hypothetical protein
MVEHFEVTWDGVLPGTAARVWDAITANLAGWLWEISYEPRVGGRESGLTGGDEGRVTAWDEPRHFATFAPFGEGHNELDYVLDARADGTHLGFRHRGPFTTEEDLDACRRHTAFYYHSLGQYVGHFAGRAARYVSVDGPASSVRGGLDAVLKALGATGVAVGDQVRLPDGGEGVVDYATGPFLGVRTADALYRVYDRGAWGGPVTVVCHLFGEDADQERSGRAWQSWIDGVFSSGTVVG